MRRIIGAMAIALLSGCISWVGVSNGGKKVELVPSTYLATTNCNEVEDFTVEATSDERSSEDDLTVVQIKAKNTAYKAGGTHVVERETLEFACDRDGKPDEEGNRTCTKLNATAYECMIGR